MNNYKKKKKPPYLTALKEAEDAISIKGETQSGKAKYVKYDRQFIEMMTERLNKIFNDHS